ncbi:MAG TPA: Isoquinoline 1-oxidoreductase subunit, partial [Kofleriaceae bacterium]|nr:Isoquinoline 1-oxidoreductase subunit [Kofleriaceae bacterium]
MRRFILLALAACGSPPPPPLVMVTGPIPAVAPNQLHAPADFDPIQDRTARSRALFSEIARVVTHPRCINCHPSGDTPHQRALELHDPPVVRGPDDRGVAGMECTTCHQDRNQELTRVPGAPKWHLAPIQMAWVGKSTAEICNQMKDPKRNGNRTLAQLVDHMAHDELVGWA